MGKLVESLSERMEPVKTFFQKSAGRSREKIGICRSGFNHVRRAGGLPPPPRDDFEDVPFNETGCISQPFGGGKPPALRTIMNVVSFNCPTNSNLHSERPGLSRVYYYNPAPFCFQPFSPDPIKKNPPGRARGECDFRESRMHYISKGSMERTGWPTSVR